MLSIAFVCMGNICRSPAAAAVFLKMVQEKNPELSRLIHIESLGVMGWNQGCKPDKRMAEASEKRGVPLTGTAQVFDATDFDRFDMIFASDPGVFEQLFGLAGTDEEKNKIHLMTDFAPSLKTRGIPDPYHYTERGFEDVLDMIETCCKGILEFVESKKGKQNEQNRDAIP